MGNNVKIGDLTLSPKAVEILDSLQYAGCPDDAQEQLDSVLHALQNFVMDESEAAESLLSFNRKMYILMKFKMLLHSLKPFEHE